MTSRRPRARRPGRPARAGLGLALGLLGAALAAEAVSEWASRRELGALAENRPGRAEAVVVLGYGNRGHRANAINRWRVRVGLRSRNPAASVSTLVLCGGAVHGDVSEAELLARHARDELGAPGPFVLDDTSRTTWENIAHAVPVLEGADRIVIASDPLHALRARRYLRRQRPDLARRLARADDQRLGEMAWLKPLVVVVGLEALRRDARDRRARRRARASMGR
ncbi:YdcF family protein [Brachybacterium huguangmaarense]|uniref:YdcF family protein n=1 Tax=Brachybacterium huguangmaarense TaxID=1652028 RepID=A0ABY6G3M3_9MICO|nr:YdcF family protein [Brachybacterium huguangmaarense]UYG17815.1 YdcF family protein [Brachybacterium huguangmaarense]